jgi:hypothetical protein
MEMIPRMKRRPEKMMELMLRSPSSSRECAEHVANTATWPRTAAKEIKEETTKVEDTLSVEGSKASKEGEINSVGIVAEEDMVEVMRGSMIVTELIGLIKTERSKASAITVANQDTWPSIAGPNPRTTIEETKPMKEK